MSRDEYIEALRDLFSKDPEKIRVANRKLYGIAVGTPNGTTEPDLALAEAAATN